MERPSSLAVLRLITNSYLVGAWTGSSARLTGLHLSKFWPRIFSRFDDIAHRANQTAGSGELSDDRRAGLRRMNLANSGQLHPACGSSNFAEPQVRYVRSVYGC